MAKPTKEEIEAKAFFDEEFKKFVNEMEYLISKYNLKQRPVMLKYGMTIEYSPVDNQNKDITFVEWVKLKRK